MSLSARIRQRAKADTQKLERWLQLSARGALTLAAAVAVAGSSYLPPAHADVPETAPASALYDDAGVVQKGAESLFEKAMNGVSRSEGVSVRFVMARSLPFGESPDDYAKELFEQWSLGDADVLLVASPKLARAGAYVGARAAARLTPEITRSLCNETYALRAGEESYTAALLDVSNRLIPVLAGREDPGPPDLSAKEIVQTYKTKEETSKQRNKYVIIVGSSSSLRLLLRLCRLIVRAARRLVAAFRGDRAGDRSEFCL
eukprot:IDg12110t1